MALPLLEAGRRTGYHYRPILVHSALVGDSYAPVILAPGCSLAWSYAKFSISMDRVFIVRYDSKLRSNVQCAVAKNERIKKWHQTTPGGNKRKRQQQQLQQLRPTIVFRYLIALSVNAHSKAQRRE
jgi:hypothetical protein